MNGRKGAKTTEMITPENLIKAGFKEAKIITENYPFRSTVYKLGKITIEKKWDDWFFAIGVFGGHKIRTIEQVYKLVQKVNEWND